MKEPAWKSSVLKTLGGAGSATGAAHEVPKRQDLGSSTVPKTKVIIAVNDTEERAHRHFAVTIHGDFRGMLSRSYFNLSYSTQINTNGVIKAQNAKNCNDPHVACALPWLYGNRVLV
jgi:hypothetical protein